jgi:predicted DNA-binding protein (MmcQ/YjbR family)
MDIEYLTSYCLKKKAVSHGFPFGGDTLVFKVMDKMFALTGLETIPARVNLKCDPEKAIELREQFPTDILPGYHMNKKYWNTVMLEGALSSKKIELLIDHSYDLVVASLNKKQREVYNTFDGEGTV